MSLQSLLGKKAASVATQTAALGRSLAALCFVGLLATASAQAQVAISISPTSASVTANTTMQFAATVTGAADTSVQWSVDGVTGGNTTAGTIDASGNYTAPAAAGAHTVTVTSNADPTQSASAAVTVTVVAVSISPTTASVTANTTQQFTATVTGTTNVGVQWSVDGVTGGNATVGTISTGGLYTAPPAAGAHTVTVTSNADPTQSASAAVTVTVVAVSISPTTASVAANTTKQFAATVTGTTNTGVQWSVDGVTGGNTTAGTISTGGLYTAPATVGAHTVAATSNADTTQSASAAVTVTVAVSISPTTASVTANTTKQFAATVTGTTNTGVQWSVDGVTGGNSTAGTITTGGLYTAPAAAGSHTVTVTSNADPTQSASAAVTVTVVAVSISPTSASVTANTTKQFAATVTGTTNTGVKWSVDGVAGGNTTVGTISTGGLYTAPAAAGSHTVTITSNADPTQTASAAVTVTVVAVSISPTTASVTANTTKQFAATVTGTTNTGVQWSVDGVTGGNSTAGTITTSGLYTAPPAAGAHTVTVTSNADPTQSASAAVTVTVVAISISPTTASVTANTTKQFAATVTGTTNTGVQWSVDGVTGGNSTAGTITTSGLYTAPPAAGAHTVTVTSNADPTKSASSSVTVTVVAISISPTTASVTANTTKQFAATVTGTTNTGVQWSVDGVTGGNTTVGTISTGGLYAAPAAAGAHTVTVTSNADPTQTASAAVTVTVVAVSISPTSASVTANTTKQFTATVTGTSNVGVQWSVDGVTGGNSTVGTISTGGLYTAPAAAGAHTVTITSNADPTQSASAAVTVTVVAVSISPTSASVTANTTKQFAATVTGTTNTGVQWSVDGVTGGNSTAGTISTGGLYTAPATAGAHTVTITSNADPTQTASAAVTVTVVTIAISPTSASINTGTTKQFTATVTGTTNIGVQWSVDGVTGGNTTVGTISTGGLYTAPVAAGSHTVTITSNADPTQTASAAVTVTVVAVSISPTSATVVGTQTKQFVSTVTGTTNVGVQWYVDGIPGGNDSVGNISTAGMYLAPNLSGNHTVTVVANADTTKSATATLTVTGNIWVQLMPYDACPVVRGTQQFTATVAGTTNQNVTWQVDGKTGGNSTVGTINSSGIYVAPTSSGSHTIKAIAQANTSKTQSVTVTVYSGVSITVSPSSIQVPFNQTVPFTAAICGSGNSGANWYVDSVAGGNATVGTIDASGNYTAPATAGTHTIKAVSVADSTKSGTATVSVASGVVADFGNRSASTFAIPAQMMGNNLTNLTDPNGMALLTQAGMVHTRIYSNIQNVFTSKTKADWTKIDPIVTKLQTAGIRPMLQITYTPGFLVPVVTGCTPSYKMPPTDYATYANIAAQMVAHMDQTFPGFVIDYEIWNEPDLASFCVNPNTDAQRRTVYIALYAAVASAMKAQAAADGQTIRIGGPTTVNTTSWMPYLLSDPNASPNVDFVSYHQYPTGTTNIQAGMTWDTPHGPQTLYSIIQGSGGFAARFTSVAKATHAGSQPNAASTPVYVSEWNDGWPFMKDCCRNDPTYAPVMNGLMILDYLNTVYSGSGAAPGKLFYYSASAFPYFCMIGVWDSQMTCEYPSGGTAVPYPSYQPYNLFSSTDYLGLQSGGEMAVSVNPGTTQTGLAATAFYTASKDAILIVNPTSTSYSGVNVTFNNAGLSSAQGTYYLIEGQNNTIVTVPVTLTTTSSGFNASVDIPPYSVIAVAIQ